MLRRVTIRLFFWVDTVGNGEWEMKGRETVRVGVGREFWRYRRETKVLVSC